MSVCGSVPENQSAQFQDLAEQLAQHLMPPKDLVILPITSSLIGFPS